MTQELPEGTVTVLFTDVEGSTELTNRLGDDAAREILSACDELVRQQVGRHRGQEVKHTGDGLMVAFTSARRAVACAVDIQRAIAGRNRREPDRAVRVRIGLNTGEVIREEADLFGATVAAAARTAGPGDRRLGKDTSPGDARARARVKAWASVLLGYPFAPSTFATSTRMARSMGTGCHWIGQ